MPPPDTYKLVDDDAELKEVVKSLLDADQYCFDTEFHREKTYYPRIGLLQIAWRDRLVLIDPLKTDMSAVAPVFAGPGLGIVHAADQDLEVLHRCCGVTPSRIFDTQIAAGFLGYSMPSLLSLLDRFLGVDVSKGDRLTDWLARPLTKGQLIYAASDVAYLSELAEKLMDELRERGRLGWAEQECELLRGRRPRHQDPKTAWWRLKETRQLRGDARAIAQEVCAWREQRAARLDIPARFVLSDMAISVMSTNPPRSRAELMAVRGVDGRTLNGVAGDEVLAAIERAKELAPSELHIPPVDDLDRKLRPAVTLVSAWISQLSKDLEIDASLLATRNDIHALLAGRAEARLSTGWRAEILGGPIRGLVDGEAALAFDGKGELVLEERSGRAIGPLK